MTLCLACDLACGCPDHESQRIHPLPVESVLIALCILRPRVASRWRGSIAAERRHSAGRERMGLPSLQTLQDPILAAALGPLSISSRSGWSLPLVGSTPMSQWALLRVPAMQARCVLRSARAATCAVPRRTSSRRLSSAPGEQPLGAPHARSCAQKRSPASCSAALRVHRHTAALP